MTRRKRSSPSLHQELIGRSKLIIGQKRTLGYRAKKETRQRRMKDNMKFVKEYLGDETGQDKERVVYTGWRENLERSL